MVFFFFFSSRRRHTRWNCDWSSDVCSSDLCRATLGYEPEELVGLLADTLVHTEDWPILEKARVEIAAGLTQTTINFRVIRKDGQLVPVEALIRVIFDDLGNPVETIGNLRDISARRQAESDLGRSELNRRLALDSAEMGTWERLAGMSFRLDARAMAHFGIQTDSLSMAE